MQPQKKLLVQPAFAPGVPASPLDALMVWPEMVSRTVPLGERRARVRLESAVWNGLDEIACRQRRPLQDLYREVDAGRPSGVALTSALRSYVLDYFRQAETA